MRKLLVLANALVQQDRIWTPCPPREYCCPTSPTPCQVGGAITHNEATEQPRAGADPSRIKSGSLDMDTPSAGQRSDPDIFNAYWHFLDEPCVLIRYVPGHRSRKSVWLHAIQGGRRSRGSLGIVIRVGVRHPCNGFLAGSAHPADAPLNPDQVPTVMGDDARLFRGRQRVTGSSPLALDHRDAIAHPKQDRTGVGRLKLEEDRIPRPIRRRRKPPTPPPESGEFSPFGGLRTGFGAASGAASGSGEATESLSLARTGRDSAFPAPGVIGSEPPAPRSSLERLPARPPSRQPLADVFPRSPSTVPGAPVGFGTGSLVLTEPAAVSRTRAP